MILTNGRAVIYGEVWYDEEPPRDAAVDILRYRQSKTPIARSRSTPFLSAVTDLSIPPDAIVQQFGKDCRYKIRRADSRDSLRMEFVCDPKGRLDEFRRFFDAFARQKAIEPCDLAYLTAACKARQLALTAAWAKDEALVWHAYVTSGTTVWLQYTSSCFRDRDNDYRALVGRANRWLHWQDMLRFKEVGMNCYDWGGLFEDESTPERAGINTFKNDFGGRHERAWNCVVPVTLKGHLFLPLRDAWHRLKSDRVRPATVDQSTQPRAPAGDPAAQGAAQGIAGS